MIPYNPSSFNTNKTILEQILELKKWLKEHPSYAVYTTYIHYKPAENVDYFFTEINGDPDFVDNIAVGDLLWFGDGYISPIASITIDPNDRENSYVTISQPVTSLIGPTGPQGPRGYDGVSVTNASVNASGYLIITLSNGLTVNTGYVVGPQGTTGPEGPEGPQGPTGPTGPTGISITNVAIDGNQHLIVTLSDGSSIDAGSVSSSPSQPKVTIVDASTSGTFTASEIDEIKKDNSIIYGTSLSQIYVKVLQSSTNACFVGSSKIDGISSFCTFYFIYVNLNTGAWHIETQLLRPKTSTTNIDSGNATNGQVLMANGSGGASWQNAGGGLDSVTITTTSGTLSVDDFNKLDRDNCILIEHTGSNYNYFTKAKEDTGTIYYKRDIADNGSTYQYEIIRATRAYTRYFYQISGSAIKSTGATNGQVLTADGSGGASWRNAGGSTKYMHYYQILNSDVSLNVVMSFISNSSSDYTSITALRTAFANVYGTMKINVNGFIVVSNIYYPIYAIQNVSGQNRFKFFYNDQATEIADSNLSINVSSVIAL